MKRTSLAAIVAASLAIAAPQAGHAAWLVFDPTNHGQNVLQAARALEQINNQIRQIQNQAVMLQNMARNLQRLDFSSLGQLQGALNRIDGLMMQAEGLSFDLTQLEGQWRQQYPDSYEASVSVSDMATAARERWQSAMNAFRQTMRVQSQIEDANKAATQEPTKYGYVNAIQVYPYTEGALYRLYAAPERVSDITMQPGEKLTSVSAGDTVRWVIGDTVSGAGDSERTHVLVKPFAPGLKTNLVITTDRRAYRLQLESTEKTAMAALSWTYPSDRITALRRQNAAARAALPVASDVALENIRFRYTITGDNPPWKPLRAFDDGHKVYIEFPRRIDQGEAPPLFVVGADGGNQLVNYRMRGNYYIVDRLFAAAELRLGARSASQVVRISRTDGTPRRTAPFSRTDR